MKMKRKVWAQPLPALAAAILVASCAVGGNAGGLGEQTVNPGAGQVQNPLAQRAAGFNLPAADSFVTEGQFQVKDADGRPLAGARVEIAGEVLTSDERGIVNLPAEAIAAEKPWSMAVSAPGFTGRSIPAVGGAALKLAKVDAQRTSVTPAGGVARNAAGNLEVQFPPGALAKGGDVAVTLTYSEALLPGTNLPPTLFADQYGNGNQIEVDPAKLALNGQYEYQLDLGGAELAPGADYQVRFKAQGPMALNLQNRMKAGDDFSTMTDKVSIDANGEIWLTMNVKGPKAADGGAGGDRKLMAVCQDLYDETVADVEANNRHMTACIEFWDPGYRNGWLRAGNRLSVGGIMTHDGRFNGGGCVYYDYDPNLYVCRNGGYQGGWWADRRDKIMRRWWTSTINAKVTWSSDDARLSGRAVPGALVQFNHAMTAPRPGAAQAFTDGSGEAWTYGSKNTGGQASAAMPGMPYVTGVAGYYTVNCSTVPLGLRKNKPVIALATTVGGAATTGSLAYPTSLGQLTGSVTNPTFRPDGYDLNTGSSNFKVDGSFQPDGGTWIDTESQVATVGWNRFTSVPTSVWFSKQVSTTVSYASNDASVPADQQPSTKWANQPAPGTRVTFNHAVSGDPNKPHPDTLVFDNVQAASTWGLNGTNGTVGGSRTANGITMTGSTNYSVNGGAAPVALNANLPEIRFKINGQKGNAPLVLTYTLTKNGGSAERRSLTFPAQEAADGYFHVFLPVEEAVGQPNLWSISVESILGDDWTVKAPDGSFNFPGLSNLHRGKVVDYPTMGTDFIGVK